jgi:ABC-type sugar transport system substrate-binding protein
MNNVVKVGQRVMVALFALIFAATTVAAAGPEMFKIAPKANKKIKIGVLDPMASIEIAAVFNNLHMQAAKARGWQLQYFDLKDNFPEAQTYMENMMSAGYDGIIIHFLGLKVCEKQIKKAFEKGIPVITIACMGAQFPGVVAEVGPMDAATAATVAELIASKMEAGDKVMTLHIPLLDIHKVRQIAAKGVFQAYDRKVAQELSYPLTGDPMQWAYDQTKNALLGDTKKEIKGVWAAWEGFGVNAARAAHDIGRDDVVVATVDDSPNTMAQIAKLPTLHGASGFACTSKEINTQAFAVFDKIFKGEQVPSQKLYPFAPRLVTKENLPPKGYFVNPCGYKGAPDFKAN